jgi:apolipoprotein N-acyltransferase
MASWRFHKDEKDRRLVAEGMSRWLRAFGDAIGLLAGWRRNAAAFLLGIFGALTLAPFYLFPLLFLSFSGLFWLVASAPTRKRAFWDGWWWGWGFFISGLYWFGTAVARAGMLRHSGEFGWLMPGALFGLTGCLAVFPAAACWLTAALRARGISRLMAFSVAWVGMEYLRGSVIADFPWNLTGYAFGFSDAALQAASTIGIYGLTWFSALLGASLAALGERTIPIKHATAFLACVWATFALSMGWGAWRLHQVEAIPESQRYVDGPLLELMQPNFDSHRKWYPGFWDDVLRNQIHAMKATATSAVTDVIWPETAFSYLMEDGRDALPPALLGSIPKGKLLIGGADRTEGKGANSKTWDSVMAIDHGGKTVGLYDKVKLVPWGEFVPFRSLMPKIALGPIVGGVDSSRGPGPKTLELPGLPPVIPLICYEVIFPARGSVTGHAADWLLDISNDWWLGRSSGAYQQFQMARVRTIEQGIPLIVVGNTGISGSVDAYGRVLASLGVEQAGILDVRLPKPIPGGTFYGQHGEWFLFTLLAIAMGVIFFRAVVSRVARRT